MNAIAEAQILLVEDNPGDGELVQEALRNARIANALYIVKDGVEAMSFLRREGHFAGKPTPDLVLLDINLPKKNGHEVLAEIRADPKLSSLAVVVLTTSNQERDVIRRCPRVR